MAERAILYARTSGDDRERDSLGNQLQACREYAEHQGYTVVAEVSEDPTGASGRRDNLSGIVELLNLVYADGFDKLVVRDVGRFSRKTSKFLRLRELLEDYGIPIEYAWRNYSDDYMGRFHERQDASIAELEVDMIVECLQNGKRDFVDRKGNVLVNGQPPYGYRRAEVTATELLVFELDARLKSVMEDPDKIQRIPREPNDGLETGKRVLVIYDPEARIVRLVFGWYTTDGLSIRAITERLTKMRVPTRGDVSRKIAKVNGHGKWNSATVRNMLKRETYAGRFWYGKVGRNDNGAPVENPRETWIPVDVPAIVSREVWEVAQRRLEENKRRRRKPKYDYLLSGRVICAVCKAKMHCKAVKSKRVIYQYYMCGVASGRYYYARTCDMGKLIRADHVDAVVWGWLCDLFANSEVFMEGLRREQEKREQAARPLRDQLAVTDKLLAENRTKLERALDLYLEGDLVAEMLAERKAQLEEIIADLEGERVKLAARLEAAILTDEQIETLGEIVREVGEGLDLASADFEKRRWLIERLNLTVALEVKEGEQWAHVECYAAHESLSLSQTSKSGHFSETPFVCWASLTAPR